MSGTAEFKMQLAHFLEKYVFKIDFVDPSHICVSSGVCSALNLACYSLFDEGDCILIPSPYYASFDFDLKAFARLETVPVSLQEPLYLLTVEALSKALDDCTKQGKRVRGILVTNPHNPLGIVYDEELMQSILDWAEENQLHFISDEIYALSIFHQDESSIFRSIASLCEGSLGPRRHILWGFSKDFGISGFRCGILFSQNLPLLSAMGALSTFCAVPNPIQFVLGQLITDDSFLQFYFVENASRLKKAHEICISQLEGLNVTFTKSIAGMFLWLNMSKLLETQDSWSAEENLFQALISEEKLVLTPGLSNHATSPGFFRLCFAFNSFESTAEGIMRLRRFIERRTFCTSPLP